LYLLVEVWWLAGASVFARVRVGPFHEGTKQENCEAEVVVVHAPVDHGEVDPAEFWRRVFVRAHRAAKVSAMVGSRDLYRVRVDEGDGTVSVDEKVRVPNVADDVPGAVESGRCLCDVDGGAYQVLVREAWRDGTSAVGVVDLGDVDAIFDPWHDVPEVFSALAPHGP
jgi:hypothetical protein